MKSVLCIGDSNTWGYDPRSCFGSQYSADVRWTGLVEREGYRVINCGQNGMSIPTGFRIGMIENVIKKYLLVDIISIMLGSNDLLNGIKAEEAAERMERFIHYVKSEIEGVRLILISPPMMQLGDWVPNEELVAESRCLTKKYREMASTLGIEFADAGEWGIKLTFDGVHFSPEGHASFARGLISLLA